ncbi:MAG: GNAT family N-acetyltransferase [Gemmatimonadetes bacterium]|nr:GNAT family N-acetyltransferase [Gemmatimonadota bacterium]
MIPDVIIREEGPGDRSAILRLLETSALPTADLSEVPGLRDDAEPSFVLAVRDDTLAGCAALERAGDAGLLRSVAVRKDERGAGIGERLVRERIASAETRGMQAIYLLTETAPAWFERFGFQTIDRSEAPDEVKASKEFSALCGETATLMVRRADG